LTEKNLTQRALLYRDGRPSVRIEGQSVILVDDGIATGSSIYAAVHALRRLHPKKLVVAVPVAPRTTCDRLKHEVDELACLEIADQFHAVGQFYQSFSHVSDAEVIALLERSAEQSKRGQMIRRTSHPVCLASSSRKRNTNRMAKRTAINPA
jgi:putative phosphoribosyl transferase